MSITLAKVNSLQFAETYFHIIDLNKQLNDETQSRRHLLAELKKLVFNHQVDQISQGGVLEETMPVGEADCCAICFDIQNSSQINHPDKHLFFQQVLKRCHKIAMTKHADDAFARRGYMIKEMGDGFLCSVGYPFQSESDIFDSAYLLAIDFVRCFEEVVADFFTDDQPSCSIGIAYGDIRSWYPTAGLRNYDLYGSSLVKATRYESFRKEIFSSQPELAGRSILILQEDVARGLCESLQSHLGHFYLEDFLVRDDAGKAILYFQQDFAAVVNAQQMAG